MSVHHNGTEGRTHHVSNGEQDEDEKLQSVQEQSLQMSEAIGETPDDPRDELSVRQRSSLVVRLIGSLVDLSKLSYSQSRCWSPVESGNVVQDIDRLLLSTFTEEELGRFVEFENEESEEEHGEGHTTQDDDGVSPTHVAANGAARFARFEEIAATRFKLDIASVFGGGSKGDGTGHHHTDWLPEGEEGDEVSPGLRHELEGDSSIDGDVAAQANARFALAILCMSTL